MVAYYVATMDAVFKALADANNRPNCWTSCVPKTASAGRSLEHFDMTRQAVSKHWRFWRGANLVVTVMRGREKLHYINPVPIHEIGERWIGKFERGRLQALSDMKKALEEDTGE